MFLLVFTCGALYVRAVLKGLFVWFTLIVEVRRRDESDGLFE
jgi:hypothetical protein